MHVAGAQKALAFLFPLFAYVNKNTLAKWHHVHDSFGSEKYYLQAREKFISHVHNRAFFYSYDLNRYHNLAADQVIPIEQTTPLVGNEKYLSTFDILLIAMGQELSHLFRRHIYVLTRDRRLARIARAVSTSLIPLRWASLTAERLRRLR